MNYGRKRPLTEAVSSVASTAATPFGGKRFPRACWKKLCARDIHWGLYTGQLAHVGPHIDRPKTILSVTFPRRPAARGGPALGYVLGLE